MLNWITNLRYICLLPCFALKCRGLSASSSSSPSSFWPLPPKNCVVTKFSAFRFFLQNQATTTPSNFFCSLFRFSKDDDAADLETAFRLSVPEFEFSRLFAPSYSASRNRSNCFQIDFWPKKILTAIFVLSDSSPCS